MDKVINFWSYPGLASANKFSTVEEYTDHVVQVTCKELGIEPKELFYGTKATAITGRKICYYLLHTNPYFKVTSVYLKKYFDKHHTTVLNQLQSFKDNLDTEENTRQLLNTIKFNLLIL